ncbi:putative chitin recognition protein [Rosellinia necatrix]|uniref:Putative chitin recognition protein n=1 Tax=Rosellinia necatrix TaxID=77044 RepID=A0A1S7ULR0_ROSNE|nr:putative chitin recognition protein [Rosellinia necatrix]
MARVAFASLLISALFCFVSATFDITSKNNVAVYYGQGPNQKRLTTYCADPTIDIIILSFVHLFPEQANGHPGINFGNQCSAESYAGPGFKGVKDPSKDALLKCPNLQQDLYTCRQTSDKKILLSLGGATSEYNVNGATNGTSFANQLWGMFGPRQDAWTSLNKPRPFDYTNTTSGNLTINEFSVDGYDLDIEHPSLDNSAGYKALVKRLRTLFATVDDKPYYLTASPQCLVPDANLVDTLQATQFDMLFVQFYNTKDCSARGWITGNPSYVPGAAFNTSGFTFDAWADWLAASAYSKAARIFLTLPGSNAAASTGSYISVAQTKLLASAFYCRAAFAGIAVWDATYAEQSIASGKYFFQNAKTTLTDAAVDTRLSCAKK